MKRRDFLKATLGLGGAAAINKLMTDFQQSAVLTTRGKSNAPLLPRRPYGRTGADLSIIGFGGVVVAGVEQKHADKVVAWSVEKGINYFDVAPTYGDAELKLGPALKPYRKKAFLACKTTQRNAEGARVELKRSLKRLETDYLDLYQLHGITNVKKDVDAAFAKGGAMEALIEARKAGVVRHLGFSAHSVDATLAAMDRYDFDSVLFPINFACFYSGNFGPQVVRKATQQNVTLLALKAMARGRWLSNDPSQQKKFPKCWYRPLSDPHEVNLGLRFALSQPVAAAIPPGDEGLFRMAVDLAMNFKPVTPAEQKEIEAWGAKVKPIFRHEDKKPANT